MKAFIKHKSIYLSYLESRIIPHMHDNNKSFFFSHLLCKNLNKIDIKIKDIILKLKTIRFFVVKSCFVKTFKTYINLNLILFLNS